MKILSLTLAYADKEKIHIALPSILCYWKKQDATCVLLSQGNNIKVKESMDKIWDLIVELEPDSKTAGKGA